MVPTSPFSLYNRGQGSPTSQARTLMSTPDAMAKPQPRLQHKDSTPVLEGKRASTTAASSDSTPLELYVAIRRGRVAILAAVTVSALLLMVFMFRNGVVLEKFISTDKSPEQQHKLLDDYNSYSGNIAALFGTPVELFVSAAVQVILLRFMAHSLSQAVLSWKLRIVSLAGSALAAYLINNGFTGMNVQLRSLQIEPIISAEDLSVVVHQSLPGLSTNITHSYSETQPHNPITNTILRNAVTRRVLNRKSSCTSTPKIGWSSLKAGVDVTFGFVQRDWQTRVLQQALPVQQLRAQTASSSKSQLLDGATSADMPMNASLAADLYLYGMLLMQEKFHVLKEYTNSSEIVARIPLSAHTYKGQPSLPPSNVSLAKTLGLLPPDDLKTSTEMAQREFFLSRSTAALRSQLTVEANTSIASIGMAMSHANISNDIAFDSITFEFEMKPPSTTSGGSSTGNVGLDYSYCGPVPGRCLIPNRALTETNAPPQIQVLGQCVNAEGTQELRATSFVGIDPNFLDCDATSENSMLVFSIGKRLTGDTLTQLTDAGNVTKVRKFFTVMIGRLSWQWSNLSSTFRAACGEEDTSSSCLGLHYPLVDSSSNTSKQMLVAGAKTLSVSAVGPPRNGFFLQTQRLLPLVFVHEPVSDDIVGDVLLPHNIKRPNWKDEPSNACLPSVEDYINSTLNNHLYSEDGLQAAYTAAVFFLFENAVVRDIIPLSGSTSTLDFTNNFRHVAVWLSVPDQSVWLTFAGCVLLVVGLGAAVLETMTLSKTKSDSLSKITAPDVIARVMLDEGQFPPLLLHRHIVSSNDELGGEMIHRKADQFVIDSLGLQHEENQDRLTAVV